MVLVRTQKCSQNSHMKKHLNTYNVVLQHLGSPQQVRVNQTLQTVQKTNLLEKIKMLSISEPEQGSKIYITISTQPHLNPTTSQLNFESDTLLKLDGIDLLHQNRLILSCFLHIQKSIVIAPIGP